MDAAEITALLTEGTILDGPHWTEPVRVLTAKTWSRIEVQAVGTLTKRLWTKLLKPDEFGGTVKVTGAGKLATWMAIPPTFALPPKPTASGSPSSTTRTSPSSHLGEPAAAPDGCGPASRSAAQSRRLSPNSPRPLRERGRREGHIGPVSHGRRGLRQLPDSLGRKYGEMATSISNSPSRAVLKDERRTKVSFVVRPLRNRMDWHDRTIVNLNIEVIS